MKLIVLLTSLFFYSTISQAEETSHVVSVDYQLGSSQSVPVKFFEALDVSTYTAWVINNETEEMSECTSSTQIARIHTHMNNVIRFVVRVSVQGPCIPDFNGQSGLVEKLTAQLSEFPVRVH